MTTPVQRRTLLAAAGATAVGLSVPGVAEAAPLRTRVRFTLNARTLDGGEQVTSLTLHTAGLGRILPASLTPDVFDVRVRATSPLAIGPAPAEYDREVTTARLDSEGNIVLELRSGFGVAGAGTLAYVGSIGRNVQLDLAYTITQNAPLRLRNGRNLRFTRFVQRDGLSNPEVDRFGYAVSASGMNYRLFTPAQRHDGRRPLIVWLHGGGEGGSLANDYYDNETPLRANRGALGFATPQAQRIFGGAYVVAPQSTSAWLLDGDGFAPQIREVIREVVQRYPIDRNSIHVAGASNGGYMTLKMTVEYPRLFASSVPICSVVQAFGTSTERQITDAELRRITTPTWLVTSRDDDVVDPIANTVLAADLIPRSRLTLYDNVTWNGVEYPGHWSWIYVARNDPSLGGVSIWEWMARQRN